MPIKFSHQGLRATETVLVVSPMTLDRAFSATNPEQYRHRSDLLDRLRRISEPDPDDGYQPRVRIPSIAVINGQICFEDGRHRALLAKLQGRKTIPVAVDRDNVDEVRRVLANHRIRGKR